MEFYFSGFYKYIDKCIGAGELISAPESGSINTFRAAAVKLNVAGDGEVVKLAVAKAWFLANALVNNARIRGNTA